MIRLFRLSISYRKEKYCGCRIWEVFLRSPIKIDFEHWRTDQREPARDGGAET